MASTICNTAEATQELGRTIASTLLGGEVIALRGPLGAGKTQFVKGLARGLGFSGEVTSPTFALIHEYEGGRLPLYHFDLYRLSDPRESLRLGLDDYFSGTGVCVIEWPERLAELLPAHTRGYEIEIVSETARRIVEFSPC